VDPHDLLRDDDALDRAVAGLGFAAATVPETPASMILERAAFYAPVAAAGVAVWKVVALVVLGTSVGVGAGYAIWGRPEPIPDAVAVAAADGAPTPDAPVAAASRPVVDDGPRAPQAPPPAEEVARAIPARPAAPVRIARAAPPADDGSAPIAIATPRDAGPTWDDGPLIEQDDEITSPMEVAQPEVPSMSSRVEGTWEPAPRPDVAGTVFRVGGWVGASFGTWSGRVPVAGAGLLGGLHYLGPERGRVRPMVGSDMGLLLLPGGDSAETRLILAVHGSPGISIRGRALRLELRWSVGIRNLPPTPSATDIDDRGAGWLYLSTGPELGLTTRPRKRRPAFHLGLTLQGSVLDLEYTGRPSLQPWLGLSAGLELPVAVPAAERGEP